MKKISLKNLNLKEVDQLSREQLKNVLGGSSVGSEGDNPKIDACNRLNAGDPCYWTYQGIDYTGRCKGVAPNYILHCSDLF